MSIAFSDDSFNNTMDKIDRLNNNKDKVYYDKIQPLNNQYCFIKVEIKEVNGGTYTSQIEVDRELRVSTSVHACVSTSVHACVSTSVHACVSTSVHACVSTSVHTCVSTCTVR